MYVKLTKRERVFLKRTKAYKVGEGASKIAKFERTYCLNDPKGFH